MFNRHFRNKDQNCKAENTEWFEMIGKEFYRRDETQYVESFAISCAKYRELHTALEMSDT